MQRSSSLALRLLLPTVVLLAVTASGGVYYVSHRMEQEALRDARNLARLILERNLATHRYFAEQLKPSVFALEDQVRETLPFDPAWMSSTYAVRTIDRYFQEGWSDTGYYYKECAIDARSPENEADPLERTVLEEMRRDPELQEWSAVRTFDGEPHYVVMLRGESMEAGCLRCHSTPQAAPPGLVERYGPTRSFGRGAGDLVSAISIRVPLDPTLSDTRKLARDVSGVLLILLAGLCLTQWAIARSAVIVPLRRFAAAAGSIATDPGRVGETVEPLAGSDEIRKFSEAFNAMSRNLLEYNTSLEALVAERTEELEAINRNLIAEVARRAAAEQEAEAQRDWFRSLFEQAADTILLLRVEPEGLPTVVDINQAGADLHGLARAEIIGRPISFLDTADTAAAAPARIRQILEEGQAEFPVTHRTGDGRVLHLEVRARRITLGEQQYILSTERDLTRRLAMERRLREAQKMEAVGTLAGGIAHDFNNMLSVILGFTELVAERAPAGSSDREDLEEVLAAARRSQELVRQLLLYARRSREQRHPVAVVDTLREALEPLQPDLPGNIAVHWDVAPDAGQVLGDRSQLRQVAANLLDNAMGALRASGGNLWLSVGNREVGTEEAAKLPGELAPGSYVVLSVADDGPGIPAEALPRIFEPFFTTKGVGEGSGMGLAVAHGVVRSHGGAVVVDTPAAGGTRVRVFLPRHVDTAPSGPA